VVYRALPQRRRLITGRPFQTYATRGNLSNSVPSRAFSISAPFCLRGIKWIYRSTGVLSNQWLAKLYWPTKKPLPRIIFGFRIKG
jgi:hypothetical protein